MAVPAAPAAGEPIAEAWGDVVHDAVVQMDIQAGKIGVPLTAAPSKSVTVTFPRAFASAPIVVVMALTGAGTQQAFCQGPTATNVVLGVVQQTGTGNLPASGTCEVSWIAYGPRK